MGDYCSSVLFWAIYGSIVFMMMSLVLRFGNDVLLKRAMHALQERTGHLPELVVPRKDAK